MAVTDGKIRSMPSRERTIRRALRDFPAVHRYLGESWIAAVRKGKRLTHPLARLIEAGEAPLFYFGDLDNLLTFAERVTGFPKLVRKLGLATEDKALVDFVAELYVCTRFLDAGCNRVNVGLEDAKHKRPDMLVSLSECNINIEVTRINAVTPRQAAYEKRLTRIVSEVS